MIVDLLKETIPHTRHLVALFGAAFLILPTLAQAEESYSGAPVMETTQSQFSNFYVELFGGFAFAPNLGYRNGIDQEVFAMDDGWNVGGSIGMPLTERLQVEFEVFYTESGYEGFSSELSCLSLNLNLIYNIPITSKLDGYIGAGIGGSRVGYDGKNQFPAFRDSEWGAGYNGVVGLQYEMTTSLDVFVDYRYSDTFSDSSLANVSVESRSNDVSLGLRMNF